MCEFRWFPVSIVTWFRRWRPPNWWSIIIEGESIGKSWDFLVFWWWNACFILTSFLPSQFAKIVYKKNRHIDRYLGFFDRKHWGQRWLCRHPYKGNSIGSCGKLKWPMRPPGKRTARSWKWTRGKGIIIFEVFYMVTLLIRFAYMEIREESRDQQPILRHWDIQVDQEKWISISKTELAQLKLPTKI